jgi:hypothetical protein
VARTAFEAGWSNKILKSDIKGSIYSGKVGIFFCRLRASMNFCIPTGVHSLFYRVKNGV